MFKNENIIRARIKELSDGSSIKYSDVERIPSIFQKACTPEEIRDLSLLILFENGAATFGSIDGKVDFSYTPIMAGCHEKYNKELADEIIPGVIGQIEQQRGPVGEDDWFIIAFSNEIVSVNILGRNGDYANIESIVVDKNAMWVNEMIVV